MASLLSHAVAALGIGACFYKADIPKRVWVVGAACSLIPDFDVIGFQYTPVLSMATCVQPSESNHSRKLTSSRVVVAKVRTCLWIFPSFKTINKQATTVA